MFKGLLYNVLVIVGYFLLGYAFIHEKAVCGYLGTVIIFIALHLRIADLESFVLADRNRGNIYM